MHINIESITHTLRQLPQKATDAGILACQPLSPFPNNVIDESYHVLLKPHQAFFTVEALDAIAAATVQNLTDFSAGRHSGNFL